MSSGTNNPAVSDRHLKKIYDCLNIGSNKKAVQKVDSLPKDVKDLTVYKALKALALIRMSKRRQAIEILDEINPEDNLDELTLQTMTSCYKESVDVSKIVDLYEAAAERKPDDPEIMAHLFMAYVRVFCFKRQKEIALQMYKSFPKKKRLYFFWAIMSLVMESQKVAENGAENLDKKVCLSLAERMCLKMIEEERTNEEIELMLIILRKQQKHEEEYRFLTGQYCHRITDHLSWFQRRRAYLCLDLKMYSRAFKHYFPTLIQEYPDQIEYYHGLFKSAFLLDTETPSQQQPVAINDQQSTGVTQTAGTPVKTTSALAECFDIVEKQFQFALEGAESAKEQSGKNKSQNSSKSLSRTSSLNPNRKRLLRGPSMGRIELYHTILSNEKVLPKTIYNNCLSQFATKFPSFIAALVDYFQAFSKKIVCHYDMDYLINRYKLTKEERNELLESIGAWIKELQQSTSSDLNSYDLFHCMLNYNMIRHALHDYSICDTLEHRLKMAKRYIDLYDEHRELGSKTSKTEFLPVDHYCLLAINAVMTNAIDTKHTINEKSILTDRTLVSLIVMAENAIVESPCNHQIKLLLLKLYSFIGASKQCSDVLLALDIKHFQIDTMGHLLNPVLYNTGNYALSRESLETCLDFYSHGIRECFEGLTTSYRDGRFTKIEEIGGVLNRLADSLNTTQCVLLKGVMSNLHATTIEDLSIASQSFDLLFSLHRLFLHRESTDKIKDSRDFKVLKSLHFGVNDLVQKRRQQTLEDEDLWLRLRYYLVRNTFLQLDYFVHNKALPNKHKSSETVKEIQFGLAKLENLVLEIKERLASNVASATAEDNQYSYLEPESSPFRWPHIKFESLVDLVKPLVSCTSASSLTREIQDAYLGSLENLVSDIESKLSSVNNFVQVKQSLLSTTIAVEFLSFCVTSLVSLSHSESSSINHNTAQQSSGTANKVTTQGNSQQQNNNNNQQQQQQQQQPVKTKTFVQQMINKTEAQLARISTTIKGVDLNVLILDKIPHVELLLLSDEEIKCSAADLNPLMSKTVCQAMLSKVKDKIMESYTDSLREIDNTCKRKIRLLRAKA